MWYDEVKHYNYSHGGFSMATGHFTQVVWAGTTHVGMSASNCGNYIFANYLPPANMPGQFQNNVFPLGTRLPESKKEDKKEQVSAKEDKKEQASAKEDKKEQVSAKEDKKEQVSAKVQTFQSECP